jgi:hypothetical protein
MGVMIKKVITLSHSIFIIISVDDDQQNHYGHQYKEHRAHSHSPSLTFESTVEQPAV